VATVAPDGTNRTDVPAAVPLETFNRTVWSHDGTHLLFSNVILVNAKGDLVAFRPAISAPDGSGFRVLSLPELPTDMYCSAWSLDDRRILCSDDGGNIISMRASDGGDRVQLTRNPFGSQDIAVGLSPTDGRLAFLRSRPGPAQPNPGSDAAERTALFIAGADGSNPQQITEWGKLLPHELQGANWAPDGQSLISADRHGTLVEIAVDGSHVTPIHLSTGDTGTTFAVTPAYSPDGSHIVFALFQRSQPDLYVANRDGSNAHPITDTPALTEWFPDWR
jgi:Tol biopolymer transport system component